MYMHKFKHRCAAALTHAHGIRHKLAGVQISTSMHGWICKAGLVWLDGSLATALHQPVHQSVHLSARPSVSAEMKWLPVLSSADRLNLLHFTAERQYCNTATCSAAPQQHSSGPHYKLEYWCTLDFITILYADNQSIKLKNSGLGKQIICHCHTLNGINLIHTVIGTDSEF